MKKLGLVGGTGPESTLVYYRELNRRIHERNGGKRFPELAVESVDLYKALGFVAERDYEGLEQYLSKAVANLEAGGADLIALTAGTMHVVFDRLRSKAGVPLVGIPETAAEAALAKGYRRVGLLGTIFTMEQDFLSGAFVAKGIEVVVPPADHRALVHRRISEELEYGVVREESVKELLFVIEEMRRESGIESVILGCTELPLALNAGNCPVDCMDIMELHIQRLVELLEEPAIG